MNRWFWMVLFFGALAFASYMIGNDRAGTAMGILAALALGAALAPDKQAGR